MGEVYRPEDAVRRTRKPMSDLPFGVIPQPVNSDVLGTLMREVESMKADIAKIKLTLRTHNIPID